MWPKKRDMKFVIACNDGIEEACEFNQAPRRRGRQDFEVAIFRAITAFDNDVPNLGARSRWL
jgi:hypothetical protein